MKVYVAVLLVVCITYCYAADKNYGDNCQEKDKCKGDMECIQYKNCKYGMCACKKGYIRSSGNNCKELKKIGESCKATTDCYGGQSSVSCSAGKCKCPTGMTPNNDKTSCAVHSGDPCKANADCDRGVRMECSKNKMCTCKSAFKLENRMCVPYLLGEDCSGGKTCLVGSCRKNKCECASGMDAYLGHYCIDKKVKAKNLKIGDTCTNITVSGAAGKYCGKGLMCRKCPNENKSVCESAGISLNASIFMGVLCLIFAFLRN